MTEPLGQPVRVRFAPSPTGHLHLGGARTALFDYLLARQSGGRFVLRIEDTDRKRFVPGAEEELMAGLRWLGISWDEGPDVGGPHGPYRQSERAGVYREHAERLIATGMAYRCFCTPERLDKMRKEAQLNRRQPRYDGTCRRLEPAEAERRVAAGERHVVRFRTPREGSITVRDRLRGQITVENRELDDFIIVKSDGLALYHLAAMVDDHLMEITHVVRGSEWLPTLPLHCHIIRAFGWQEPEFVHLSVFLKPSGKGKMSKRESADLMKDGYSIFVKDLRSLGYTPEAVVNWIALMGWSLDDRTEFFTLADLVAGFSLERLNPSPAAINFTKLDHFNGLHIRALPLEELARRIRPHLEEAGLAVDGRTLAAVAPLVRERLATLDESVAMAGFFFREEVAPRAQELVGKHLTAAASADVVARALQVLEGLPELTAEAAEPPLRALAAELALNPGQVFGILRIAVTGQSVSPPLLESMAVIGKEKVLARVRRALELLRAAPPDLGG
jgi:glutamyl-tRNA synthetase